MAGDSAADHVLSRHQAFREFLYADLDRARSLFAQLVGGVPEEERMLLGRSRSFNLGVKNYLGYEGGKNAEDSQQRSLLDALLPELESLLESQGWLTDVSNVVHDQQCTARELTDLVGVGSIVRVTADAQLFDAEYVARILAGASVTIGSVARLSSLADNSGRPQGQSTKGKGPKSRGGPVRFADTGRLEDLIEDFDARLLGGASAQLLRDIVRVSRGMFSHGLHLLVSSRGAAGWTMTARLQQGRLYLDAEPEVLFSRFGIEPQEWTIIGTIGQFASSDVDFESGEFDFLDAGGKISRSQFVTGINSLMGMIAGQGLADTPPFPGFSIVPMAVYRLIPQTRDSGGSRS
jgi:hypothetical protein